MTPIGTGWCNCEARIYRLDTSTDFHIVDAAILEADDSRMKRTLTAYRFTGEQQLEMKNEAEASWAADGYIVLSDTKGGGPSGVNTEEKSKQHKGVGSRWRFKVRQCRPKCCIL